MSLRTILTGTGVQHESARRLDSYTAVSNTRPHASLDDARHEDNGRVGAVGSGSNRNSRPGDELQLPVKTRSQVERHGSFTVVDFSSRSNPQGYVNKELQNHANGEVVKITAFTQAGPFFAAKYTDRGPKVTRETRKCETLEAAFAWAYKHLRVPQPVDSSGPSS